MAFGGSPVASLFVEFGADTSGFDKGVSSVEGKLKGTESAIGGVLKTAGGFALAQAGIAGVGSVIDGVIGQTTNFDTAMRELNVLAKMNDQDFQQFSGTVLDVSSNLGVDATQSVNALTTAIGSGVPQENIISFIENSTKAAIGGSADLQTVVAGSTGIIKAYGMEWDSVNKVQDTFLQIADDGVTTVEELARNMGGVAPIANAAGVSFGEMSAVYSTLTGVTGNTSEVTTQLKGALTSVIKPSSQATALASQMGLEFNSTALSSKGLGGFLQDVGKKADAFAKESGMSTVDVLGQLFGSVEGLNAVLALTGTSQDQFAQNLDNINNSAGKVDQGFQEMNKSFARQSAMFKSKLNAIYIQVGSVVLPILMRLASVVMGVLSQAFNAARPAIDGIKSAFTSMAPVLSFIRDGFLTFQQALSGNWTDADGIAPLHSALGNLGLTIRNVVIPAFQNVVTAVSRFVTAALPYLERFASWYTNVGLPAIITFVSQAYAFIYGQLLPAIVGFAATVMPYLTTFANWFTGTALPAIMQFATQVQTFFTGVILPAVQTFVTSVLPLLQQFGNWITQQIPTAQQLGTMLTNAFTQIGQTISTVLAVAVPVIIGLGNAILPIVTSILPQLQSIWTTVSAQFSTAAPLFQSLRNLFEQLQPAIMAVGVVLGGVLLVAIGLALGALKGLAGFIAGALPGAIQVVTGVINVVSGILQVFSSLILGIVKTVAALLRGDWSGAWDAAKQAVSGMASGIGSILSGLVGIVTGLISGLIGGVLGLISGFVSGFLGFFANLASEAGISISGLVSDVTGKIAGFVTDIPSKIGELVTNSLTALGTFVTEGVSKAGELVTQVTDKIGELVTAIPGKVTEAGTTAVTEFGTFVSNAVAKVGELPGLITGALGDLSGLLTGAGKQVVQGFIDGITGMFGDVQSKLGELTSMLPDWKGPADRDATILEDSGALVIGGFINGLQAAFPDVQLTLENITDKFADSGVKAIADAMKSLFDATKAGVDALNALVDLTIPSNETVTAFKVAVEFVVQSLSDTAALFAKETLEHAKTFGDSAKSLVEVVGSGAEALGKLNEFVAPSRDVMASFKFAIEFIVQSLSDSAALFTSEALTHAQQFAEAAKPIAELISSGVEALTSLVNVEVLPNEKLIDGIAWYAQYAVRAFQEAAGSLTAEGLKAAQDFANAAKPIFELIKIAVESLTSLVDTVILPNEKLIDAIAWYAAYAVGVFQGAANGFTSDGLSAATAFANAAGAIFGVLKTAVEGLTSLVDVVILPAETSIDAIAGFSAYAITAFMTASESFSSDGLTWASAFAESAGSVLGVLSQALDLSALDTQALPAQASLEAFVGFTALAVSKLAEASNSFDNEGLKWAGKFAETAGKVLDVIGKGVEGVTSIVDFKRPALKDLDEFVSFTEDMVNRLADASNLLDSNGLDWAGSFADTASKILDLLGKGADFSGVRGFGKGFVRDIDGFLSDVKLAVQKIIELGQELGTGLTEAEAIATKINTIVDLLAPQSSGSGSSTGGDAGSSGGNSGGSSGNGRTGPAKGGGYYADGVWYPTAEGARAALGIDYFGMGGSGGGTPNETPKLTVESLSATKPTQAQAGDVHIYIDGREMTDLIVENVVRELRAQGVK